MPSGFRLSWSSNPWKLVAAVLNKLHGQPATYDKKYVSRVPPGWGLRL